VLLALLEFGFSVNFIEPFYLTLADFKTWCLVLTIILIVTLGDLLSSIGYLTRMVRALRAYISPRAVARIAPALIGLLPMPGGAMVSAPIIEELAKGDKLSAEIKTASNFWWRHIWEPVWPLYQSVILAAAILDITVWRVAFITFPITIASILSGLLLMSLPLSRKRVPGHGVWLFLREIFFSLWPVFYIVLLGVIFKIDLVISVFSVFVIFLAGRITSFKMIYKSFRKGFSLDIFILFFAALTLMKIIASGQSAIRMSAALQAWGIPADLVVFSLPFLVGLLTGLTSAYVGVGFPIVSSMFALSGGLTSGVLLAYGGGLMGIMASPVHLCLVLTKNYFNAEFRGIYRLLLPVILVASVFIFAIKYIFYPN
jgi:integral membrane protein (TIGR00529 family)